MKARRIWLLGSVLFIGAAPARIPIEGPLPACRTGEFLTVRNRVLGCRDLVARTLSGPPNCPGMLAAPVDGGGQWTCVPKGHVDASAVAGLPDLLSRSAAARKAAERLHAEPPQFQALLVGTTKQKTTGLISWPGVEPGLLSARAMCSAEFPGSHLCTGYELNATVAAGRFNDLSSMPKAWVFHPARKAPLMGAQNVEEGLADTCASYTYGQDDRGWSGISATWKAHSIIGRAALHFIGGASAPCSGMLPLHCCK